MNTIRKLFAIFDTRQRIKLFGVFVIQFVGSFLELLGVSSMVPFIQAIMTPEIIFDSELGRRLVNALGINSQTQLISVILLALIIVYIVKNIYMVLSIYIYNRVICNEEVTIENTLMNYFVSRDYVYFTTHNTAELQRMILTDSGNVFLLMTEMFLVIADIITGIFLVVFLLYSSTGMTIALVLLLGLFLLLYYKVFQKRFIMYGKIGQREGAEGMKWLHQVFGGIKEVKANNKEKYFVDKFMRTREVQFSMNKRMRFFSQAPKYVLEMFVICGILLVLLIKINLGADGATLMTQLAVFAIAAYRLLPSANRISSAISSVYTNKASVDVIYDAIMEWRHFKSDKDVCDELLGEPLVNDSKYEEDKVLEFDKVSFIYPNTDKKILDNVSFSIEAGESVGIKGASGAGKTTVVDILLGLLAPSSGSVKYNGISIGNYTKFWREKIGYIPQTINLCDDTIRNNIAYGVENPDDEKVWRAVKNAQLLDFINSQPEGLDLIIGEAGVRLSGGQRQRIGIARALYNDPDILVLDEATSALDNETEQAFMEAINYLKGTKTLIIIAHRLSTIEKCDSIYKVENGNITKER